MRVHLQVGPFQRLPPRASYACAHTGMALHCACAFRLVRFSVCLPRPRTRVLTPGWRCTVRAPSGWSVSASASQGLVRVCSHRDRSVLRMRLQVGPFQHRSQLLAGARLVRARERHPVPARVHHVQRLLPADRRRQLTRQQAAQAGGRRAVTVRRHVGVDGHDGGVEGDVVEDGGERGDRRPHQGRVERPADGERARTLDAEVATVLREEVERLRPNTNTTVTDANSPLFPTFSPISTDPHFFIGFLLETNQQPA